MACDPRDTMRYAAALLMMMVSPGVAGAEDFLKGPWLQNVTPDGIVIRWEADQQEAVTPAVAYGKTTNYELPAVNAVYTPIIFIKPTPTPTESYHFYSAALTGLSPDTAYHYRVTSGSTQSADATFVTAPAEGSTGFRFYVISDTHTTAWRALAGLILADMREYPNHHQTFILHCGDMSGNGDVYSEWANVVPPAQRTLAHLPMYVALGNHDDANTTRSNAFNYGYFSFPSGTKWRSFNYGNIHVANLALFDTAGYKATPTPSPQYTWISNDLASARQSSTTDWIFVTMHFLPWSIGSHGYNEAADLRTYLHPLFRDSAPTPEPVTCAFGGHNHLYCRYAPVDGVTYITSGLAGGTANATAPTPWPGATPATVRQNIQELCIVDVEENAVSVRAVDVTGKRLDYVTFGKTSNLPPFADAGSNVTGIAGSPITLDGSASADPDGGGLTYSWSQVMWPPTVPTVSLSGENTAQPSFTTTLCGDYLFMLRVFDGTDWSAPDFCVATVAEATLTFNSEADTYIDSNNPTTNYGSATWLNVGSKYHTYLRFNVTGVPAEVIRATLRLYGLSGAYPCNISTSSDTTWAESSPTWNNPLPEDGSILGAIPAQPTPQWYESDVTDAVHGNGAVTFVILEPNLSTAAFRSNNHATITTRPQLVVAYGATIKTRDSDSDGMTDYEEIYWDGDEHYNPYPAGGDLNMESGDTDGDGVPDVLEIGCGGDPLTPGLPLNTIRINFQPVDSARPTGYARDRGAGYSSARSYGWR